MASRSWNFAIGPTWADSSVVAPVVMDDAVFEFPHIVASHAVNL